MSQYLTILYEYQHTCTKAQTLSWRMDQLCNKPATHCYIIIIQTHIRTCSELHDPMDTTENTAFCRSLVAVKRQFNETTPTYLAPWKSCQKETFVVSCTLILLSKAWLMQSRHRLYLVMRLELRQSRLLYSICKRFFSATFCGAGWVGVASSIWHFHRDSWLAKGCTKPKHIVIIMHILK